MNPLETYQAAIREALKFNPEGNHYQSTVIGRSDLEAITSAAQSYAKAVATEVIGEDYNPDGFDPDDIPHLEDVLLTGENLLKAAQRTKLQQLLKEAQQ